MRTAAIVIFAAVILIAAAKPSAQGGTMQIPPLPAENGREIKSGIILLKEPMPEAQINELLQKYPDIKLREIFTAALTGFSIEGTMEQIRRLEQEPGIETFSEMRHYQAENIEIKKIEIHTGQVTGQRNSNTIIGAEKLRGVLDKKGRRLTGKGVTVGIIDTGLDYTHPDLRRNYAGGKDFVDGDGDPMETRGNEAEATLHGTHVAGIIAANGKIRGVAPDAKIKAYRALGPGGSGSTEMVLSAIERAIKDKVDIMNLSLGNDVNGPDLPISVAINRAADKGIVPVVSSGNSGPGQWTVGSPGTAAKAISVGASTPFLKVPTIIIEGTDKKIKIESMSGSDPWTLGPSMDVIDGGFGKPEELKMAKNKLALVRRGNLTFTEKARNAKAAGARAVIIYNNSEGGFMGNLQETVKIPVGSVSKAEGKLILQNVKAGRVSARIVYMEESDHLASFSSRGPVTGTWEIKPDVVAPGVAITSTVPGGYLALNGTSMAAPHVAGACALIKQAHPDWSPAEVKAAVMNTSLILQKENGIPYKTFEQGAGRIQADKAAAAESLVLPGSLAFGKVPKSTWKSVQSQKVTVKNKGGKLIRYAFSVPQKEMGMDWKLPLPFVLEPGQERDLAVSLTVDPALYKKKVVDGALVLNAGGGSIRIPYIFALPEPAYPRVMGFSLAESDSPGAYRYEVYLPGGAEEFGIALFRQEDFRFAGFLDFGRKLEKGLIKKEIKPGNIPGPGVYIAKAFARKAGKEDMAETVVQFTAPIE